MILVTGGAGFIGANFVLDWLREVGEPVTNLDKLTYAGNLANLAEVAEDARHCFERGDICERARLDELLRRHRPRAIVHFAAESHVDRSILDPAEFVRTNILGTFTLLEAARDYWLHLPERERAAFRFLHVSSDEVYGSLEPAAAAFTERSPCAPNSPYSATKAAADHLLRAWQRTYGLPTLVSHSSNNYGPFQFPEKLIPRLICNALAGRPLPLYGNGTNVRDWLYVADHCAALRQVLAHGRAGETYNIGAGCERTNIEVARTVCRILDELLPDASAAPHEKLIAYVPDRPGHDQRYAIDTTKIESELGWRPRESFEDGIRRTVRWYLDHQTWVDNVASGQHRSRIDPNRSGPDKP